ncbi:hypothetical protein FRB91_011595 [Serendipita sp. 411]|nr:hypothetical protein FRB91_011595 [Serendipita sp. 411]
MRSAPSSRCSGQLHRTDIALQRSDSRITASVNMGTASLGDIENPRNTGNTGKKGRRRQQALQHSFRPIALA